MGLMDRILTAIPDSDWRQAAHERRSPSFAADNDEFFRRPRERDAAQVREAFEAHHTPARPTSEFARGPFEPSRVQAEPPRARPSWHERFQPGDEYAAEDGQPSPEPLPALEELAGQDDYEPQEDYAPQEDGAPCEHSAPAIEPELEPVAVLDAENGESGETFAGTEASPPPVESEPPYVPEFYPLGDGLAIDSDGFLADVDGRYLKGLPLDPSTGVKKGDTPAFVCVEHHFLPAKASREVRYQANLPAYPMTAASDMQILGSELLDVEAFSRSPAAAGFGMVTAEDSPKFLSQSLSGGSVTLFDQTGSPVALRLRWAKMASSNNGGADRWNLFYLTLSDAIGREVAWRNAGLDYTFSPEGRLDPALPRVTLNNVIIDGLRFGDVTLVHGRDGVTQFAGRHGVVKVRQLVQDGHVAGDFVGLDMSDEGRISARYSNGRVTPLADGVFTCGEAPMSADPETLRAAARLMGMAYDEAA